MPGTGYNEAAMRIGLRRGTRSWRFSAAMLMILMASIAVGATVASLFK